MKFFITFTTSKLLAYLVLLVGTLYSFIDLIFIKSNTGASVLTTAFASSATIIGIKTGADAFQSIKTQTAETVVEGE